LDNEEPDCSKCLPEMYTENVGQIEKLDVFKIMELVGIKEDEQLYCFDLINHARNEVLKSREVKT